MRFKEGVDDPDQVYILIVGGPELKERRSASDGYATPPFRAIGWMTGSEMSQEKYRAPYGKGNFSVPAGELNEMAVLPVMEDVH